MGGKDSPSKAPRLLMQGSVTSFFAAADGRRVRDEDAASPRTGDCMARLEDKGGNREDEPSSLSDGDDAAVMLEVVSDGCKQSVRFEIWYKIR